MSCAGSAVSLLHSFRSPRIGLLGSLAVCFGVFANSLGAIGLVLVGFVLAGSLYRLPHHSMDSVGGADVFSWGVYGLCSGLGALDPIGAQVRT